MIISGKTSPSQILSRRPFQFADRFLLRNQSMALLNIKERPVKEPSFVSKIRGVRQIPSPKQREQVKKHCPWSFGPSTFVRPLSASWRKCHSTYGLRRVFCVFCLFDLSGLDSWKDSLLWTCGQNMPKFLIRKVLNCLSRHRAAWGRPGWSYRIEQA